jgi:hypothetical protein
MINTNRVSAFLSGYLLKKEYFLSDNVRNALNMIYYYIKKGDDKTIAVHKVHNYYKYKKKVDLSNEYLWREYNVRQAHVKNGIVKFKVWTKKLRETQYGLIEKLPFCACGCGERVTKKGNTYIHGHHRRCLTQEQKNENTRHMREVRTLKGRDDNVVYLNLKSYKNL